MQKINLKLEKFQKALSSLEAVYTQPICPDRLSIDATIQRFEFTFELAWKFLKDYFSKKDIELHYPKEILQEAFAVNLIENEDLWIRMLRDRNMTSHTYDEKLADEIYKRIQNYVPELRKLCNRVLLSKNIETQ